MSPSLCPVFTEVVEQFGIESILIFNALLLKKKVVVYAPSLETVLRVCRYVSVISSVEFATCP